jgi:hypothetical protein
MYTQQIFSVIATPKKPQEITTSLASLVLQHYRSRAEAMSTVVVELVSVALYDGTRVFEEKTYCDILIQIYSQDQSLVDKYLKDVFQSGETANMTLEMY